MLVDTHCHLNFDKFETDRSAVLERAWEAGVTHILNPGIDLPSSIQALALANSLSKNAGVQIFVAVGVHPTDALSWDAQTPGELQRLALFERIKAIGEIGLDYYWDKAPIDLQKCVFVDQLALAAHLELPVVIHSRNKTEVDRRCTNELLDLLDVWVAELHRNKHPLGQRPGVLHSFSDGVAAAQRAVDMGFYIGITGPVTFRKAQELRDVVAAVPLNHLLIETDAPFLTPHPHRGERNEPAYVRFVAAEIAKIHNLAVEAVMQQTTENAARLFQW